MRLKNLLVLLCAAAVVISFSNGVNYGNETRLAVDARHAISSPDGSRDIVKRGAGIPSYYYSGVNPDVQAEFSLRPLWSDFLANYGTGWHVEWNEENGTVRRAYGPGFPLSAAGQLDAATVETLGREFVDQNQGMFGVSSRDLVVTQLHQGHNIWYLIFEQVLNGVPVYQSRVDFRITHDGVLALFGTRGLVTEPGIAVQPVLSPEAARDVADSRIRTHTPESGELVSNDLVVWNSFGRNPRLAYVTKIRVSDPDRHALWIYVIDARDGNVIRLWDGTLNVNVIGAIEGRGWFTTPCDGISQFRLPDIRVSVSGGNTGFADQNGEFNISHGGTTPVTITISPNLRGRWASVFDQGGSELTLSSTATPGTFATHVVYPTGTAEFNLAEVSSYYATTNVHNFFKGVSGSSAMDFMMTTYVNINSNCNAFYDGNLNMYRAGSGCSNTGFTDVIYHEYGHAIDDNLGGIPDGSYSEGFSDAVANFLREHPILDCFYSSGGALRNSDHNRQWPSCSPTHDCGNIYAGFCWHFRGNLITSQGPVAGKALAEQLLFDSAISNPTSIPDAVLETFVADDNDGNLNNGTPHYSDICAAATQHNFNCPTITGTASTTRFTDTTGTDKTSYTIGVDGIFVTLDDSDEAGASNVQVTITNPSSGDSEVVSLVEVSAGIFRNAVGVSSVSSGTGVPSNGIIEGVSGNVITASYVDNDDAGDTSNDTATLVGGGPTPSTTRFTNSGGSDKTSYSISVEGIFITVDDLDESGQGSVSVTVSNAGNGDSETVTLAEVVAGSFRNGAGLPSVLNGTSTSGNGTLEALNGDTIIASYTDNDDGSDTSNDTASMIEPPPGSGLVSDITMLTHTGVTKSQMIFTICYTNIGTETLGDNETVDPRLKVVLFNGKLTSNDFSSLLPSLPVMGVGATFCTGELFGTVPKSSNPQIQKILNSNIRARSDVLINGVQDPLSPDWSPFKVTERDAFNDYFLNQNDENQDVDSSDGFGGIDPGEGEPDGTNNTGNEGFFGLTIPNQAGEAIGTALSVPSNVGADGTVTGVDISAADFGGGAGSPAMVGIFRSTASGEADLSSPLFGPAAFSPVAANSSNSGDHFTSISFSPATVVGKEFVHVVYFFGDGASHGVGIDNPAGAKGGANAVHYERTAGSTSGYTQGTKFPIAGNMIARVRVNDVAGASPLTGGTLSAVQSGWRNFGLLARHQAVNRTRPVQGKVDLVRVDQELNNSTSRKKTEPSVRLSANPR